MNKIVVMIDNYKPNNSAVGICMASIIEQLKKTEDVCIICEKTSIEENDEDIIDGERIYRFISRQIRLRKYFADKSRNSHSRIGKWTNSIKFQVVRVWYNVVFLLSRYSVQNELVDEYLNKLEAIDEKLDYIIPTCLPIESMIAACKYCDKHISTEFIPVLFDKFADNGTLHRTTLNKKIKWKSNLKIEKAIFSNKNCKKILFVESWDKHLSTYFPDESEKCYKIEHPLLINRTSNSYYEFDKAKINCVYTGTLTYASRNPSTVLKCFEKICETDSDIVLHIFGLGDAMQLVEKCSAKNPDNIKNHGSVPTEIARAAMSCSDVLISIGNTDITQTPSKLFEYMSCGKNIIHFAKKKDDPVLELLKSYPLALCVLEEEVLQENTDNIINHIKEHLNERYTFEDVAKLFPTALPEYSTNIILN